jgi:hypothetical protein
VPSVLAQQMSALIGDYFYATLLVDDPNDQKWNSVYINMYKNDLAFQAPATMQRFYL